MDKTIIGRNIDEIRKMKGLTMTDLSDMVGIRVGTVSHNIFDGNMPLDSLFKYAEVLGVKPYELLLDASDIAGYEDRIDIATLYPYNLAYEVEIYETNVKAYPKEKIEKVALEGLYKVHVPSILNIISSESFTEREKEIIEMRWKKHVTFKAIAEHYELTPERIRQLAVKIVRKLYLRRNHYIMADPKTVCELKNELNKTMIAADTYKRKLNEENVEVRKVTDRMSIVELDTSVRTYNCLKRGGFNYIDELVGVPISKLANIRNMGRKSLDELLDKLERFGIGVEERENGELFTTSIMTQ
ncbi:MAG: helix-turn-helix domain-containing protein [Oribacterium sp.]|nr:helix-turn-helix domain-containing protein [Oribacterium sp.]